MNQETWSAVDAYIGEQLIGDDPALEAAQAAADAAGLPSIAVSPALGKLLHLLAKVHNASSILEIGTLAGYSTIWLARALPDTGRVTTLEYDQKHADIAQANIKAAGLADKVDIRVGKALDTLPQLQGPYDLFFIDADKVNNPNYFTWALKLSRPGSVIIVDNVVRNGRVVDETSTDPNITGTRKVIELLGQEPRVTTTMLQTVGAKGYDGFAIALVNP